ncbi:uncharacterized protein BDW43DRAFT_1717 [Aspergillus alliaceus]|uniref:uncharacterized protein n=1 Tax=Petromyces alliaceus TaxID=209559 RepID=UPI0012A5B95A|nr:uncharacterized protein BDW43DRAFT_1717 [Aspergillus alliaceus]KAB8239345.1 hypothetical protein BDW43DRAFT_1717 [Aspergillus alliaceus]
MNSWWPPNNVGNEPPSSTYPVNGWPTPHVSNSNQPSPSRREHALQPPPLTTALSGPQFHGLGVALGASYSSTPLSTTSLSSPFTQSQSPAATTPGGIGVGSSSMASRQYNVPYNPQDWGPVGGSGQSAYVQPNNMLRIIPQARQAGSHSDMTLSPPPPPYSPPSQPQQQHQPRENVNHGTSGRGSASPGAISSYNGAIHNNADASTEYRQRPLPRTRPLSMVHMGDAGQNRHVSLPPPPPPLSRGVSSSRSSSQQRPDTYREPHSLNTGSRPYIMVSQQENLPPSQSSSHGHMAAAPQSDNLTRPPTSRRAVSAGPVVNSASTSRATSQSRSRSPPGRSWEPGMPLPPPPPGPPPTTRSQSVSGLSDTTSLRNSQTQPRAARTRPPPVLGTGLDSIPPTPAGWVDEGPTVTKHRDRTPLAIDTVNTTMSCTEADRSGSHGPQSSTSNGLFRSPALRDPNAKGIRERRIERRNRQSQVLDDFSAVSTSSNPWADALDQVKPSNLVLEDTNAVADNTGHQQSTRVTPSTSHSLGSDGQQIASRPRASSTGLFSNRSSFSTPRGEPSPLGPNRGFAHTPPFSPGGEKSSTNAPQVLPPRALPTPPLQSGQDTRPPSRPSSREDRPVSHLLHLPNEALPTVSALSPRRVPSQKGPSLDSVVNQDMEFVQNAIQRHKTFIDKEAGAADEAEALNIFTEFIISESQIRRERYAKVWDSSSFNVENVRHRLFEMPPKPQAAPATLSRRPSRSAPRLSIPQSRPESAWWNNYQPCLSPIASLSMSNDEMSSRGRAPSRWWESKSSSEGGARRIERSRRESKYMGLPRESLQWPQGRELTEGRGTSDAFESTDEYGAYGPDEYPPEKVGWHEEPASSDYSSTVGHNNRGHSREARKMDVSRLITLPPPYPRHHPAVNNSHPDLVNYRTLVRSISDLSVIKSTRQRHKSEIESLSQSHQERMQEGRRCFKANIQSQIQQGSISFAEAAEAEAALIMEENKLARELAKQELDSYQESVLKPMHEILTERVNKATASIDELRSKLFDDAQNETPDQTQEEGDEKPELLEKLTQLKWLFEAREQLHREMYELVSDRDEKYKTVVLLPYKQKANEEKVRETNAFFAKDALDRRVNREANALARLESFLAVIEENVVRGVEIQLSAFWDIAPSLLALVQQIPGDLAGFQLQIPANEYEENPSYQNHPLQYLYTLLSHAEKSSYQYIESQTNLFCLLHEVKSAVMRANCKLMEAERVRLGEVEDNVRREMQATRAEEERSLTNDLKDKVATVEGQWAEALGSAVQGLRERVKEQLVDEDGWEELEQLEE